MEKTEKLPSQLLDQDPKSHCENDNLASLKLLADVVVRSGPIDTKETSGQRPLPLSRSGRRISMTWKVKENRESIPAINEKSDQRTAPVSRSRRSISDTRKVKENCNNNLALDSTMNDPEIVALALILVQMHNKKTETCTWSSSKEERKYSATNLEAIDRNQDEPKQLNEKKCIRETTAQGSSRKRKLSGGEIQSKAKKRMKGEPHVCGICGKSFATGVQLGGHKRAHYKKEPTEPEKCWSVRKCADSQLHFYLTVGKNDE